MKQILLAGAAMFFSVNAVLAQQPIRLLTTDMPVAGSILKVAKDTFPVPAVNYGQKGANKVYDFSNLVVFATDTIEYRALTTPQSTKFPSADVAVTTNGSSFLFTNTTTNNFVWEGLDGELLPGLNTDITFSPKPELYRFPTQYNGKFSGSYGFTKTVPGSSVGQPAVNQVRITFTSNYTDTIDGWGKVSTPFASYKCLRQQRHEKTHTVIEAAIIPNFFSTISDTRDTTTRYTYLTKEAKGSVITFNYDTAGYESQVTWSLVPPTAPEADFDFAVGTNGQVTFTDSTDGYPTSYSWNYGDNSSNGTTANPSHTYAANGNYYVCLTVTNPGGSDTYCDTVKVATIGTANQKPLAVNDSTFTTQPNSVTVAVIANDSDPDFNQLTISSVFNFQSGNAAISSNSVIYTPNTGFTGWDYFDYAVCDNGSPSLCDTARVYINVGKQVILPASSFTSQQTACTGYNFVSTSQNADSLVWKFEALQSGLRDTILFGTNVTLNTGNSFNYSLCLFAYNEDGVDSSCTTLTYVCTAIETVEEAVYTLYPNPASDNLFLRSSLPMITGVKCVRIYDIAGRQVSEIALGGMSMTNTIKLETTSLQSGSYIAEVVLQSGAISNRSRLMIQK
jgi:PKD repeat protein